MLVLTQTWLTPSVFDHEIFDDRYVIFRKDRDPLRTGKTIGEGVLIGIKSVFNCWSLPFPDSGKDIENVWVKVNLSSGVLYVCGV